MRASYCPSCRWEDPSGKRLRKHAKEVERRRVECVTPPPTAHRPPPISYLPPTTYHLPPTTYHLPPTTYHLPPTTAHHPPRRLLIEEGREDADARAMISRRRVAHLLAERYGRAFTDASRRRLSDIFMYAVSGHHLGHGAMSEATKRGDIPVGRGSVEVGEAAVAVERPFEWCGMGQAQADAAFGMPEVQSELKGRGGAPPNRQPAGVEEAIGGSLNSTLLSARAKARAARKAAAKAASEAESERQRQQHIDTARMDFTAFVRMVGLLLDEWRPPATADAPAPRQLVYLAERMWPDATQGLESVRVQRAKGEEVTLAFQDVLRCANCTSTLRIAHTRPAHVQRARPSDCRRQKCIPARACSEGRAD